MLLLTPALAVIEGSLCQLTREGVPARSSPPLATAVVEFLRGPMCVYVRELPHGFLPGIANVYCLDGNLRLVWMAEWPESYGPCIRIVEESDDTLTIESESGALIRLDAATGKTVEVFHAMAAAG